MSAHTSKKSIHQSIEAAMGCLDLTLESELTLFRNRHPSGDHESLGIDEDIHSDPTILFHQASQEEVNTDQAEQSTSSIQNEAVPLPVSEDLAAEAARLLDVSVEDIDRENELHSEAYAPLPESNPEPMLHEDEDIETPAGAIVPSKALLPSDPAISSSATLETYTDPALDDYLESSEVLLQHLDTPIAKRQLDDSVSLKWFGWAAGATLVISVLAALFLQNLFKAPEPNPSENQQPPVSSETEVIQPTAPPSPQPKVDGPDLSEGEFKSVDPGNLGSLPTPEKPPEASETPPQNPEATPPPTTSPPSTSGRQYYVVTNYVDEASLTQAKTIVPEAQVVNFTAGTRIQLKQFSDEAAARTAAAQIRQQGLAVEILATAAE